MSHLLSACLPACLLACLPRSLSFSQQFVRARTLHGMLMHLRAKSITSFGIEITTTDVLWRRYISFEWFFLFLHFFFSLQTYIRTYSFYRDLLLPCTQNVYKKTIEALNNNWTPNVHETFYFSGTHDRRSKHKRTLNCLMAWKILKPNVHANVECVCWTNERKGRLKWWHVANSQNEIRDDGSSNTCAKQFRQINFVADVVVVVGLLALILSLSSS